MYHFELVAVAAPLGAGSVPSNAVAFDERCPVWQLGIAWRGDPVSPRLLAVHLRKMGATRKGKQNSSVSCKFIIRGSNW